MIIVAILKHVAGKSADYGAALDYLKYEHSPVFFERESKIPLAAFYLFEVPILIGIRKAILEYSFSKNFEK